MWTPLGTAPREGARTFFGTIENLVFTPDGRLVVSTPLGWTLHDPESLDVLERGEAPGAHHLVPLADGSGVLYQAAGRVLRQRWRGAAEVVIDGVDWLTAVAEGLDGSVWLGKAGEGATPNVLMHVTPGGVRTVELYKYTRDFRHLARSPDGTKLLLGDTVLDLATGGTPGEAVTSATTGWVGERAYYSFSNSHLEIRGIDQEPVYRRKVTFPLQVVRLECDPSGSVGMLATQDQMTGRVEVQLVRLPTMEVIRALPVPDLPAGNGWRYPALACSAVHWARADDARGCLQVGRFDGEAVRERQGYPGAIRAAATNGRISVWTGVAQASVVRLDHATGALSGLMVPEVLERVAVSADGAVLATAHDAGTRDNRKVVRLDPAGARMEEFPMSFFVKTPVFSPDGTHAALPSMGRANGSRAYPTQVLLQALGGKKLATIKAPGQVNDLVLTSDRLYVANGHYLRAYVYAKGAEAWLWVSPGMLDEESYWAGGTSHVHAVGVLATDLVAASWMVNGQVGGSVERAGVTLLEAGAVVRTWETPAAPKRLLGHDGRLYVGWGDGRVECWDGETVALLGRHGAEVLALGVGEDGLWSVSVDGTVRRWPLPEGRGAWWRDPPTPVKPAKKGKAS